MFDFRKNYALSRTIAREGMVLLKNEGNILPLTPGKKVKLLGDGELAIGGGGSALVQCEYARSLKEGLEQKAAEGKLTLCTEGEEVAIALFQRYGREGYDRAMDPSDPTLTEAYAGETVSNNSPIKDTDDGYYILSEAERAFFEGLTVDTVLILNVSDPTDFSFIEKYPRIKGVLLAYLPGMEAGCAIADLLCGDQNPCGKLTDTIARRYEDYPSSPNFNTHPMRSEYQEGIFMGYRHFETLAPEAVLYPFGFGLSYTEFTFTDPSLTATAETLTAAITVTNRGKMAGKEVVQVYSGAPQGAIPRPAKELRGYGKTRLLAAGESQRIEISFPIRELAYFDAEQGGYYLPAGEYPIYLGNSVRAAAEIGRHLQAENILTEPLPCRFSGAAYDLQLPAWATAAQAERGLTLFDVAKGTATLEEFICQLSPEELIHLAMGQPPAFPSGTAGLGNLPARGIPNPQTADGSAGIRRSVAATCFPCGTLVACTWDPELQFQMGAALGFEGVSTGVDILLAPSLNLHRNPRCGRNFEYFSEDPLIAGKTTAALVRGVQSEGMLATLKHFAANNCELNRKDNNSILDERTLRELYLKGFEIAVKESDPAFIMTSYNLINGVHASAEPQLLRGVLREEWGFRGAVMTDWRNYVPMDDEILAGNNIKMPFGYFDEQERCLNAYHAGKLSLAALRENAYWVAATLMRSKRFADREFGPLHTINGRTTIPAVALCGLSTTRVCQQGESYLYRLHLDQRQQRTFLLYRLEAPAEGTYTLTATLSTNTPQSEVWFEAEGKRLATLPCASCADPEGWYDLSTEIRLPKGETLLKVIIANEPHTEHPLLEDRRAYQEDLRLKALTLAQA